MLAVVPVLLALVISLPIGYLVFKTGKAANPILAVFGVIYSIPSLALFVFMPLVLGTQILDPRQHRGRSGDLLGRPARPQRGRRSAVGAGAGQAVGIGDRLRLVASARSGRAAAGHAGDLRRAPGGRRCPTSRWSAWPCWSAAEPWASCSTSGFGSFFYTPIIVGLVLTVVLALIFDAIILLIQRGALPWARRRRTGMNIFDYLLDPANWTGSGGILHLLLQHLAYTGGRGRRSPPLIAIPLGILIGHTGRGWFLVIGLSNAARAIPSLGLLVLVVLLLGTGRCRSSCVLAILALPVDPDRDRRRGRTARIRRPCSPPGRSACRRARSSARSSGRWPCRWSSPDCAARPCRSSPPPPSRRSPPAAASAGC